MAVNSPTTTEQATEELWFVYLVRCQDNTLYTGMTNNVEQRLAKHNRGTGARYTRARRPVQLVYQEIQASRSLALKREYAIKGLSRREKESLIQNESTPHCEWKPGDSSLAR